MHLTASRKEWIENRLEELAEIFAVAVSGFSMEGVRAGKRFSGLQGPLMLELETVGVVRSLATDRQRIDQRRVRPAVGTLDAERRSPIRDLHQWAEKCRRQSRRD